MRVWQRKREDREGQEIAMLRGHTGGLRCLQYKDSTLVTGSWDKVTNGLTLLFTHSIDQTLRVWDLERSSLVSTIAAHDDSIWCLQLTDDCVYSGSKDELIKGAPSAARFGI